MNDYPKIIVVEKYKKETKKSFWKLLILFRENGKWMNFCPHKFNSWIDANNHIKKALEG